MNRKRRHLAYPGMGYPGGGLKNSVFTRKPQPIFEEVKLIYGEQISGGNGYINDNHFKKNPFNQKILQLILQEKKRQFNSYITYGALTFIAILLLIFIMNLNG